MVGHDGTEFQYFLRGMETFSLREVSVWEFCFNTSLEVWKLSHEPGFSFTISSFNTSSEV